MSIEHISAAWKAELDTGDANERFYIDPRGLRYPPLTGHNIQYNSARSDYNFPGSKSVFIGTANYPSDGLVAHYTMDNVTGSTLTDDFGANDGTISGAVQVAGVPGLGKALRFDGVDDYVFLPAFSLGVDKTVSAWIKRQGTSVSEYQCIASKSTGSDGGHEFSFYVLPSTNELAGWHGSTTGTAVYNTSVVIPENVWTYVVMIITVTHVYFYIDGEQVYSSAVSSTPIEGSANGKIGGWVGTGYHFNGDIDDVRIYNRALTATEIEYLYNVRANVLSDIEPDYLVDMPEKFTLRLVVRPWFDYTTAFQHVFMSTYITSVASFIVFYRSPSDDIFIVWRDGGTQRHLASQQFDDGTTYADLNQWLTIDVAIDLSTGTTAGSQLWINKVSQDTTWNGAIDAKVSNFPRLDFGHSFGAYNSQTEYAYAILIPNYVATNADVQNDFADVKHEQIVWDFNGEGVGRTRCDITDYVMGYSCSYQVEEMVNGSAGANIIGLTLDSKDGAFNDDVYAAFDPTSTGAGRYNGTTAQKYLQTRARVEAETWYGDDWDLFFAGKVDESLFKRSSQAGGVTTVTISAEDAVADIATSISADGDAWEDYRIADTDEDNSLIHTYARIGSQKRIRNYASDSGFENATITTAWTAGGSAVLARDTVEEFLGVACAEIDCTLQFGDISQTVLFTGNRGIAVGETYTFQVFVKCATAATVTIALEEHDSYGMNDRATEAKVIPEVQDYYELIDIHHTITDGDSDRLVIRLTVGTGAVVYADCVMLHQGKRAVNWYVDNTATTKDADDYAEGAYDAVGFDVEPLISLTDETGVVHTDSFTVPWAVIRPNTSPWKMLKLLADASAATYIGCDHAGVFRFRCALGGWADPTNLGTVSDSLVGGVQASIQAIGANKVIVHGVRYVKYDQELYIWGGTATRIFGDNVNEVIANGGSFPDPDVYGRFYADLREAEDDPYAVGGGAMRPRR